MARILVVSSLQIHPTLSGGNLRTYALVNALTRRGAEVFVYSFVGRKKEYLSRAHSGPQRWPSGVEEYVNRSLPGFIAGYGSYVLGLPPLWLTAYLRVAGAWLLDLLLPRLLREKLAWCDVVIADFPYMHPVFASRAARGRVRVQNTHNIEHHLYAINGSWRDRALRRVVKHTELRAASQADLVVGCSLEDKSFFDEHARVRHSVIVPNGVDVERFATAAGTRRTTRESLGLSDSVMLVLFTASKWGPNQEAFEFIRRFAEIHERDLVASQIHFLVVGGVADLPLHTPALTVTGKVESVEAYFAAADVGINPLLTGAGTNVKVGEFIAAKLPVLVTKFGARGYRIEDRHTGFVFDRDGLLDCLLEVRRFFDAEPAGLAAMTERAYSRNAALIDMNECVVPIVEFISTRLGPGNNLKPNVVHSIGSKQGSVEETASEGVP